MYEVKPGLLDDDLVRPDSRQFSAVSSSNLIRLDKNENMDPNLSKVIEDIASEIPIAAMNCYPNLSKLYALLADHFTLNVDQLYLAAGSDGIIRSMFELFISPGDLVVHTQPTFAMYSVYCQIYAAKSKTFSYKLTDGRISLDLDSMVSFIRSARPKLVCLPNPDSPTGIIFDDHSIKKLLLAAKEAGSIVLIDEAYYPFSNQTVLSHMPNNPNLVIARTFSKAYGLAGVRVGFAIANSGLIKLLNKIRPMYEVGALSAYFVEKMLMYSDEVAMSVERLNQGKAYFLEKMESLGFKTLPSAGNFMHVNFSDFSVAIYTALKDKVLYRHDFPGTALQGFSRFTAAPKDVMSQVVFLIENTLKNINQKEVLHCQN